MKPLKFTREEIRDHLKALDPDNAVKLRTLQKWTQEGLLRASIRSTGRKGDQQLYAFIDLVVAYMIHRLRQHGIGTRTIRESTKVVYSEEWVGKGVVLVLAAHAPFAWLAKAHDVLTLTVPGPKTFVDLHQWFGLAWESVARQSREQLEQHKPQPVEAN